MNQCGWVSVTCNQCDPNLHLAVSSNSACFMKAIYIIILFFFFPPSNVSSLKLSASLVFDTSFLLPISRYPDLVHFQTTHLETRPFFLTSGYFLINLL